jgi:Protein of unknown function (DUF2806)
MTIDAEVISSIIKDGMPALEVLAGSKAVALFIDKISGALGWYLEPMQKVRNARAEVAISIIKAEAEHEAKSVQERAATRLLNEEEKYQRNMENISLGAIPNIKDDARPNELDEDWLSSFYNRCRHISDSEMQNLWSQVLSGEVNQPGSFSLRTVNLLATLSKADAIAFRNLCPYVWIDEDRVPVITVTGKMLNSSSLFRLDDVDIFHLDEINLVSFYKGNRLTLSGEDMSFDYHGRLFKIKKLLALGKNASRINGLPAGFVKLTQAGRELARISKTEPNWLYMDHIITGWRKLGFQIIEVSNAAH